MVGANFSWPSEVRDLKGGYVTCTKSVLHHQGKLRESLTTRKRSKPLVSEYSVQDKSGVIFVGCRHILPGVILDIEQGCPNLVRPSCHPQTWHHTAWLSSPCVSPSITRWSKCARVALTRVIAMPLSQTSKAPNFGLKLDPTDHP
eukprot:scaffold248476_cov125-Cyclotella_meneghiniana.AAC.2